jgi:hypothetical protein
MDMNGLAPGSFQNLLCEGIARLFAADQVFDDRVGPDERYFQAGHVDDVQ